MTEVAEKRCYEAPTLTVIGTFEQVTQATGVQDHLDKDYPVNTPFNQLTFS